MPPLKNVSLLNRIAAKIGYFFLKLYILTLRIDLKNLAEAHAEIRKNQVGSIFLFWHDSILLMPLLNPLSCLKPTDVLISYSKDGDIASEMAKLFPNVSVVRVQHTSRLSALNQAIDLLNENHNIIITPDGPRGPRHKIKGGALFAATAAKASIIPVVWAASKQITLNSWDRFRIPLPFSKVHLSFLPNFSIDSSQEEAVIKKEIEEQMDAEEERLHKACKGLV